jgi:hypothetical protein
MLVKLRIDKSPQHHALLLRRIIQSPESRHDLAALSVPCIAPRTQDRGLETKWKVVQSRLSTVNPAQSLPYNG